MGAVTRPCLPDYLTIFVASGMPWFLIPGAETFSKNRSQQHFPIGYSRSIHHSHIGAIRNVYQEGMAKPMASYLAPSPFEASC